MSSGLPHVTFLTAGLLPVPAVDGGAVESLVETLAKRNEIERRFDFEVVSIGTEDAKRAAAAYAHTNFTFLDEPKAIAALDKGVFALAKGIFKKRNVSAYRYVFQRLWFIHAMAAHLAKHDCGTLVVENHPSIYLALKRHGNAKTYAGRYFYHLHNEFADLYGCKDIALGVSAVLSISRFVQDSYDALLGGLAPEQKRVLKNCIDCERFAEAASPEAIDAFRSAFGLPEDAFVFMFSGRVTPEKGVKELLQAFSQLKSEFSNVYLLIVGSAFFRSDITSDYEEEVKELAEALADRVVFTGYIPQSDIAIAYAAADACCFPSMWEEPAGLAVLEGMAAKKPVITTLSGGIPEYAQNGSAILVERDGRVVERLAEAMRCVYTDAELRQGLSERAWREVQAYDSSRYLENFANCIEAGEAG